MQAPVATDPKAASATDSKAAYHVFFSHKVNDKRVTSELIDLLRGHTENVEYFISEEIERGVPWRKNIADHLTVSSCLVLVFTDPAEDWGWCLYETGFFDALSHVSDVEKRRIYCLHNASTDPPDPIADLQTIPATKENVEQWLSELFDRTNQTGRKYSRVPELADKICQLFTISQKPIYCQQSIDIFVDCDSLTSPNDLPDDSTIKGDSRLMDEVFGSSNGETDWKTVKKRFRKFRHSVDANITTLNELAHAIYAIYKRDPIHPVHGVIFVEQGPKRYRPIINQVKELTSGRIRCQILLIESASGQLQNVDKSLAALLANIRMAVRVRWEIIRPFASNVRRLARRDDGKLRFDLQTCFNNVSLDGGFRGYFSTEDILNAFESAADRDKVLANIEESEQTYPRIWQGIGFPDVKETFGEVSEQPMSEQDLSLLETGLKELEGLNGQFLDMALARAQALIRRELEMEPTAA